MFFADISEISTLTTSVVTLWNIVLALGIGIFGYYLGKRILNQLFWGDDWDGDPATYEGESEDIVEDHMNWNYNEDRPFTSWEDFEENSTDEQYDYYMDNMGTNPRDF